MVAVRLSTTKEDVYRVELNIPEEYCLMKKSPLR
jgi:hypothetical protein